MSGSLQSGLDGPKWAPVGNHRLRSQSRSAPDDHSSIVTAPCKPPTSEPTAESQALLAGSVRKLFPPPPDSSSLSSSGSVAPDSDLDDTPRPVRVASDSFLRDFVPRLPPPGIVQDIVGVASAVAGAAKVVTALLPDPFAASPVVPPATVASGPDILSPGDTATSPPRSPIRPSFSPVTPLPMAARTTLPHSKYLRFDWIQKFDGSPSELDGFDNSIKQMLLTQNLPLYYGGSVRGELEEIYEYVSALEPGCKPNYTLGARLCAGLTARFENAALRWWQDYDGNRDNLAPNCWRRHADHPRPVPDSVPATVTEVSLYDLLRAHFNTDMDAREAELELERFRWKPFEKDGMNVTVLRGHVERLMKRAGISGTFQRIRTVRNCLPPKFKDRIGMETTEDKLWQEIHKVYVTTEIDYLDLQCHLCGKTGHTAEVCRSAPLGPRNLRSAVVPPAADAPGAVIPICTHCRRPGHVERSCWAKYGRPPSAPVPASAAVASLPRAAAPAVTAPSWRANVPNTSANTPANATNAPNAANAANAAGATNGAPQYVRIRRTCFRCGKDDHLVKDCPQSVPLSYIDTSGDSPFYAVPLTLDAQSILFDDKSVILDSDESPVSLPLHLALTQSYAEREVFEVNKSHGLDSRPSGCLWSLCSTVVGQHLLTVWDTGAVVAVVPLSTITQTGTDWVQSSDIDFVMADGVRHSPLGHAPKFIFRIGSLYFVLRVYVVASANYQLLLGTGFMHAVGAALFPRWRTVVLTSPVRISVSASTDAIQSGTCPPLEDEVSAAAVAVHRLEQDVLEAHEIHRPPHDEVVDRTVVDPGSVVDPNPVIELADPVEDSPVRVMYIDAVPSSFPTSAPLLTVNAEVQSAYRLGTKDLVGSVDSEVVESVDTAMPVLTPAFVMSTVEFGPDVPDPVRLAVCQDIIDYSHVFSWNAFDLGCITDFPHRVVRLDHSPAIQPSRPHLYTPFNDAVLHAKCDPLIQLGIFTPAPPDCMDRTQLTIVRTAKVATDRNDPKFCRVAHDFRVLNDKIQLDPEPVDSVVDMLAWMGDPPTGLFFKTDADRGFYQIVCDPDAINSTCFELFHRLWVSSRMLFGQKNGPATFKRNAMIMQEELLTQKKTKSYFDDIIGKASDYSELRLIWVRLLQLAGAHGWKFKPSKTKWGFSRIETVGFEWSANGIDIGRKNRDAVNSLVFPRTKSELRGLLGLANQFRERIAGYALLVTALTALTRGPNKNKRITATPEAIIEFENLKSVLSSPPVLQQFRYDRPTFVYTDASVGSEDLPGGLGVVVVQTGVDGKDYVCAYASSGLTPAQKNYHIVRLELLAFVFACGKFYDWLAGISFVWRSDCRAHEFLHTAKWSQNSTIARYALALAEFDFQVEWVPGLQMIADSFSRMVLTPAGSEAVTLPVIVFGNSLGRRIAASRAGDTVVSPVLFYSPARTLIVQAPLVVEIDDESSGWQQVALTSRAEIPVSNVAGWDSGSVSLDFFYDETLPAHDDVAPSSTVLEELDIWPRLSRAESQRLTAVRYLRRWILSKDLAPGDEWMRPVLQDIARRVHIGDDGVLWKQVRQGSTLVTLEVIDTLERLRAILVACHEGLGHRQMRSAYRHFAARYWVPAAAKLLKRHILSCKVCQCFADARKFQSPGFSPTASDVFTHWSVDFAGPFPKDAVTGMEYVIIAVEWVTRWAEAEATRDASPETAANFLYSRVICRYGCIQSLQSDNGPHFVNPILRNLTKLLQVRHHFSSPYYPQSNGKVERVVGTLKAMLKRTVAAAAVSAPPPSDDVQVFGVDLGLDEAVLDAIVAARDNPATPVVDEDDIVHHGTPVHWSPLLDTVLWVYRATPHSATGMSPALLAFGCELRMPFDRPPPDIPLNDDEHKAQVLKRVHWVVDAIPGLRELQVPDDDGPPPVFPRYQLGQQVWKRESRYDTKGFVPVFAPRWTGPFVIHSVYDKGAYKLRTIPSGGKKAGYLRNPVNASRLKPFVDGDVLA